MARKLSYHQRMYNLYTKFIKILEVCKQFSQYLVNEAGNIPRRGPVPKFSDLEVIALSLAAETESIDSEKWLFDYRLQEYKNGIPNLIARRQFDDRRKKTADLCEKIHKRIAMNNVNDSPFNSYVATLYVPKGSQQLYESAPLWGRFNKIKEMDATGIEHVQADGVSVIARQGELRLWVQQTP